MDPQLPTDPPAGGAVPRRAAIASVGALVAGVGAIGIGAGASTGSPKPAAGREHNARDFGATGDGSTDDTAALQKALDGAGVTGGIVVLPPGTYVTRRLTLHSGVHLRGSGGDATVLRLAPRANTAVLESYGFATESAARSSGGISGFSIRDLTVDGNRAQGNPIGCGMRIYGYGYEISDVIACNCGADGIVSDWGTAGDLPSPSHQMEARLTGLRTHDNGGDGVHFAGPHDSMFLNCLAFKNGGTGFDLSGNAYGTLLVNCHAWGIEQNVSFELAASGIGCVNCYADLDGGIGVRISRNDCRWIAGYVQGANHAGPGVEIGIQFVPGTRPGEPAAASIDTQIRNCGTAAIDFGADRGLSSVRATLVQPEAVGRKRTPAPGFLGTPAPDTLVEVTQGLADRRNLVVRPAFDLRAQPTPDAPGDGAVRVFARESGGAMQLCVRFPNGDVRVLASE
jgi:hypothetical protein